jgi:hypothetical protein
MMKKEHEHIHILLERFFDGLTSNDEERELYRYFMQDTISGKFAQYAPVIKYFSEGITDELVLLSFSELSPNEPIGQFNNSVCKTLSPKRKRWIVWSSVAASFLLVIFTSLYFLKTEKPSDPFEGSYIIRNGIRITDLDLIRPELEATIQKVMQHQLETDQLLVENSVEMQIIQRVQAHYKRILDNIQDEEIRQEVAKILYTNF